MLAVFILALVPMDWLLPIETTMDTRLVHGDKFLHAFTFAFLTVWFAGQYDRGSYWKIGTGLIGFGMLIEIVQHFVPSRTSDWFDLTADVVGIIIGVGIALAGIGGWAAKVEDRLLGRRKRAGAD